MPKPPTRKGLSLDDLAALGDLVRFGVMAVDQIARRYADPVSAADRLLILTNLALVRRAPVQLEGDACYVPTNLGRAFARVRHVTKLKVYETHIAHDVALVDLADTLTRENPAWQFVAERQVFAFLNQVAPSPRLFHHERPHRPDGLLVCDDTRIAVELEHSDKFDDRYTRISRWFACEWRVDKVRWYVDKPRISERLRHVNWLHGFDRDIDVEVEPFPPGVRIRQQTGALAP